MKEMDLSEVSLSEGSHCSDSNEMCINELVSLIAAGAILEVVKI